MIISKMFKLLFNTFFLFIFLINQSLANDEFNEWLKNFKVKAISSGISEKVVNELMSNAKFLPL